MNFGSALLYSASVSAALAVIPIDVYAMCLPYTVHYPVLSDATVLVL